MPNIKAPKGRAGSQEFARRALAHVLDTQSYREAATIMSVHPRTIRRAIQYHYPELYFNSNAVLPQRGGRIHANSRDIADLYTGHSVSLTTNPATSRQLTLYKRINTPNGFVSIYNSSGTSDAEEFYTQMRHLGYSREQIREAEALAAIEHKRDPTSRIAVNELLQTLQTKVEEAFYEETPEDVTIRPVPSLS